ncbi:MAG: ATP-binding protein [Prevotella sp.]|jgi:putative ATP-binding protein|nr:ATP-binding protein [Prevotella sp.]
MKESEIEDKTPMPAPAEAPSEIAKEYEEKTAVIKQDFSDAVRAFDTVITKSYLSELTSYNVVPCTNGQIPNMRWIKVNEIVYEKDEFFVDKMSMLYNALHSSARNICFLLRRGYCKDNKSAVEVFMGTTDISGVNNVSGDILEKGLKGLFPGVSTERSGDIVQELKGALDKTFAISCVSGVASLREDDKKERFVQGLEKLLDSTNGLKFAVFFVAEQVEDSECASILCNYENLYSAISPMAEVQLSFSQSETRGVSEFSSKNFTENVGISLQKAVAKGTANSKSHTENSGTAKGKTSGWGLSLGPVSFNRGKGDSEIEGKADTESRAVYENQSIIEGINRGLSKGTQQGEGRHTDKQESRSQQITFQDRRVKHYQNLLDKEIDRLQNALPYALWSMGTYFIAEDDTTATALAGLYKGCIVGDESNSQVFTVNNWSKHDDKTKVIAQHLLACQHPRFVLPSNIEVSSGSLVSSKELAIHMSFPQSSVPGILVREETSFGREVKSRAGLNDENAITIGNILHLGEKSTLPVQLSLEELSKHTFVTGSTGSGKSNTLYLIIDKLIKKGKKVLVIEPTKGDYRKVFGGMADMTVYSTRENEMNLLKINPFAFPEGIQVNEHVERLVEIFGVCWPMYAAMPAILKKSIICAYSACGWDIRKSECRHGRLFPTIADVVLQLKKIIASSEYSANTKGDYIGALQTRLESLQIGIYSTILSSSDCTDYEKLYDQNAIIDLHHIGSTETRSLLMAMLVLGLNEWRMSCNADDMDIPLQHVTVIEEAHNILPRVSKHQSQEGANVLGKSVEMIADVMSRIRTYGEGFIIVDQSPSAIDESAIRNTNTKIVMNLPDGEDCLIAGRAMSLTKDKQISKLSRLATGEAVVWQRGWNEAVLALVDEMSERIPLRACNNVSSMVELQSVQPSSLFMKRFVKNEALSDEEQKSLQDEIVRAMVPSCVKSELLDVIHHLPSHKESALINSVVRYLGLDVEIIRLFAEYNFVGSLQLKNDLRDFIADDLAIYDTDQQDELLSMVFIWASSQNEVWHKICQDSLPSNPKSK